MIRAPLLAVGFCLLISMASAQPTSQPRYTVEDGGIVARGPAMYYGNRALYGNNSNSFVLGGDRPLIRYARGQFVYGTFMVGLVRGDGVGKWLHLAEQIKVTYQPGRLTWVVRDPAFDGVTVTLRTVPMAGTSGMAIQVQVEGARTSDRLVWTYGGARRTSNASWDLDVMGHPELLERGFVAEDSANNSASVIEGGFSLSFATARSFGRCSVSTQIVIADASAGAEPTTLSRSSARTLPIVCGVIDAEHLKDVYWSFQGFTGTAQNPAPTEIPPIAPTEAFAAGMRRQEAVANQVVVSTPDPHLNVMASAAAVAVDGAWYPPVFVHGAMLWNSRLPGWRTIFGGTVFGWHDRILAEARFYTNTQVRESNKVTAKADPATLLTEQHRDSRFYGVGRIQQDQRFYDMQSQLFDQLVHAWRWTGDAELESVLRPSLELHLRWLRECFDPDEDGIYESYINSWPSDSVWYNGGGSVEASMYAYRGHAAARDMARRANDSQAVQLHTSMLDRIGKGFFEKLWIQRKGHAGAYREQGGHQRLHEDPWLYSIFLPIDAGTLLTHDQAVQSLRYSETMLQNDRMPLGGRAVYSSNWVPGIWSVREKWPGDNYHLALAYFQTGMAEDGWDLLRGSFMQSGFGFTVPGNLGAPAGGTDFGDCMHMFCRAMVEGLFGYAPDYPNNVVNIAPQFPAEWDKASIKTPDLVMQFDRVGTETILRVELTRAAPLRVRLPMRAERLVSVTVDGQPVESQVLAGIGQSVVQIDLPQRNSASIVVEIANPLPQFAPVVTEGNVGERITLRADRGRIVSFIDPQGALDASAAVENGVINGMIARNAGHHTVIARADVGGAPQRRLFHFKITDPIAEEAKRAKLVERIPDNARWEPLDITQAFNGDIRTIFQQQYLSPRPDTVSVRIGTDGYSPWTFWHWRSTPPPIKLDGVGKMLDSSRRLVTPQRVPFAWQAEDEPKMNVAFTSLWDNWPDQISVPVNKKGDAIFMLVAGSTNVMQCNIANAVITLHYADGQQETLELVPPINYWNLTPIHAGATAPGQQSRSDYTDPIDAFAVPQPHPQTVQLGENCRAMLLNHRLRPGAELQRVSLETLSQEVVVGLMGLTIMNPQ